MFFLHTFVPPSVLVRLGSWPVHWYGVTLALGVLAGYIISNRAWRQSGGKPIEFDSLIWWVIVAGLVGARLGDVFGYEWWYFHDHLGEIWKIWHGGLSFYGGLAGGALAAGWWCRRHRISWWKLGDVMAPGLALGQAIGRWGNYFNQELFGKPTALPWGIPIASPYRPSNYAAVTYFHPTFLYESIGLALLTWWLWRVRQQHWPAGAVFSLYLIASGLLRLALEFIRLDEQDYFFGLRGGLVFAVAVVVCGVVVWWSSWRKLSAPKGSST